MPSRPSVDSMIEKIDLFMKWLDDNHDLFKEMNVDPLLLICLKRVLFKLKKSIMTYREIKYGRG